MPLSEHEQRLLDQIERALYAEDPKFASTVLFALGLVLLVVGVVLPLRPVGIPVVSVLGFLVMFAGAVVAIFSRRVAGESRGARSGNPSATGSGASTLAQRMEQRFRRRFEEH
jgi:hypothetical protein